MKQFDRLSKELYGAAWQVANGTHLTQDSADKAMRKLREKISAYGDFVYSEGKPFEGSCNNE